MIAGNHGHLVSIASSAGLIGVNALAGRLPYTPIHTPFTQTDTINTCTQCFPCFLPCVFIDYCASKFAAVGFAESMALELLATGADGVKTTIVCPFFINTGMFDGANTK